MRANRAHGRYTRQDNNDASGSEESHALILLEQGESEVQICAEIARPKPGTNILSFVLTA